MYFRTRKSITIRQGKPQTPTRVPIIIDESPSKKEEIGPNEGKFEEVTPPKTKTKSPITPMSRPTIRSVIFEKTRTQSTFEEEKKEKLQEDWCLLQERQGLL